MTNKEFIEAIAPLVQKHAKSYGYGVPSAIIAQACLESAYGTSGKAKYHNYFGMKYRAGRLTCDSGTFTDTSKEQKSDGSYIDISTKWYKFESMDKGVEGYFQFISISNYADARKKTTPEAYLTALKAGGYATSINYVKNLMAVIEKWNLTQYDKKEEVKTVTKVSKPTIKTNLTTRNYTKMSGKKNKYIVIHYTGSTGSALNNTKYFKSTYRGASANYFVDPNDIYCCVKPSNMAWHCGDKAYVGTKHPYYGKCTNGNSIGIEMCCEKVLGKLHINSKTITNTAKLVKWLMQEYDIPASRVIRHHDVSGKSCPNANGLLKDATWKKFHKKITGVTTSTSTTKTATTTKKTYYYTETGKYQVIKTPRVIRDTPKTTGKVNGYIKEKGIYTITKVEGTTVKYGKLKSGAGYICLRSDYVKKV